MYVCLHVKYRLSLSDFNEIWIFRKIFEKYSISDFMKFRPLEAEFFLYGQTGKQTRHDEAHWSFFFAVLRKLLKTTKLHGTYLILN